MQARHAEGLRLAAEAAQQDGNPIIFPAPTDREALRKTYGGDPLDDDTLAFVFDPVRSVADTVNHYFQPVHWSKAGTVPVTYLLNERDRPIPAALQDEMLTRLGRPSRRITLDSGHIPAVTQPETFAELLREAG
jgi:pimeloyl-ACP methyl ester carboxylesterase